MAATFTALRDCPDGRMPMTRDALKAAVLESLRMNRSVVLLIAVYVLAAFALGRLAGFGISLRLYSVLWMAACAITFMAVVIPIMVLQLYRERPAGPIKFVWNLLATDLRIVERGLIALPCILLFPIFTSAFTSVKSAIPLMHPYSLDPLFARLDSLIHGGHAWELIHPAVGYPIVTYVLNFAYNLWFIVAWIIFALVAVMIEDRKLREQYLVAFCACWILLGSVAAIVLSSAGPCYYGLLYPTDPYAPLMSYLRSVNEMYNLMALKTQDMLWESHVSNRAGPVSGISAMPSLHVAVAMLNAVLLSKLSRAWGIFGWIYLMLILVGSVHLGWHYAIDGYVSIIAVLLIWRAAGWWVSCGNAPAPVLSAPA